MSPRAAEKYHFYSKGYRKRYEAEGFPTVCGARMSAPNAAIPTVLFKCLTGRRVFVTGGATGIGASIVQAFAAQGADVAFIDIAGEPGDALARALMPSSKVWWSQCARSGRIAFALTRSRRARRSPNGSSAGWLRPSCFARSAYPIRSDRRTSRTSLCSLPRTRRGCAPARSTRWMRDGRERPNGERRGGNRIASPPF